MARTHTREAVYEVIDGERDYQDERWNPNTTISGGEHSWEEWFVYMTDYINEAQHILSREAAQVANEKVAHIMRKITTMGVAAMEQNGALARAF